MISNPKHPDSGCFIELTPNRNKTKIAHLKQRPIGFTLKIY